MFELIGPNLKLSQMPDPASIYNFTTLQRSFEVQSTICILDVYCREAWSSGHEILGQLLLKPGQQRKQPGLRLQQVPPPPTTSPIPSNLMPAAPNHNASSYFFFRDNKYQIQDNHPPTLERMGMIQKIL
jgi:hypothetical protein